MPSPGQSPVIPTEEDLPILVAALDSRDLNTTSLVVRGLGELKSVPAGPEALGKPDPPGPSRRLGHVHKAQQPGESLDRHTQPEERQGL